ncbi:MAG: GGDEF domain-containing protein [Plesiomonas sp.]|uniref:GGDEF domain-containing protein n=1 Tax=Plesiomonas sp. TaxID=2486279 RepID=UPI003F3F7B22
MTLSRTMLFIIVLILSNTLFYISQSKSDRHYIQQLNSEIHTSFRDIYSNLRRIRVAYANADFIDTAKITDSILEQKKFSLIVLNNNTTLPLLYPSLSKTKEILDKITDNQITLLSLIQKKGDYGYFSPYKPYYKKIIEDTNKYHNGTRIIEDYNLPNEFNDSFLTCDIRISELYTEQYSFKKMFSVFMPIFNKNTLAALVVADLSPDFLKNKIDAFNATYNTHIRLSHSGEELDIPCVNEPLYIDYPLISTTTLINSLYSLLIATVFTLSFSSYQKLKSSAFTDGLTQLHNRHYFLSKQKNLKQRYSVIIIDIDNFKKINDTYGHHAGDQVLKAVAERIKNSARQDDLLIRWGGEEFVLIVYTTNKNAVNARAESIRQAIADQPIGKHAITVSLGTCVAEADSDFDEVFQQADMALYASKSNGKNQVTAGSCSIKNGDKQSMADE